MTYRNREDVNNYVNCVSNLGLSCLKHGFPIGVLCISCKNIIKQNTSYSQYKVAMQNTNNLDKTLKGSTVSLT